MAENDALKESQEQYREQKARASDLSRDLDLARREIKAWQTKADLVDVLEPRVAQLEAELADRDRQIELLGNAAEKAGVNTSQDAKRAAAFLAIREALLVK